VGKLYFLRTIILREVKRFSNPLKNFDFEEGWGF